MAPISLRSSPLVLLLAFDPTPALAQATGAAKPDQVIVVTGQREVPGSTPLRQIGQQDIEAYGAGTIGELIGEISAESGRPDSNAFLVNGRRISDLSELSDYPPEVLERVDVLGAGAGIAVGQPAAARVYNLVLRRSFDGRIGRAAAEVATEGHWSARRADVSYTGVRDQRRLNLRVGVRAEDSLLESDRGLLQPLGLSNYAGRFRTLRPELLVFDVSASAAMPLADWLELSTTGKLSLLESDALLGFSEALGRGREQERKNVIGRLNLTLNAQRSGWDLNLLGRYEQNSRRVLVEGLDVVLAPDRTTGTGRSFELDFTGSRHLFDVPSGPIQLTLGANLTADRTISRPRRDGAETGFGIGEGTRTLSGGLTVPITSRSGPFLPLLGDLHAAFNFGATRFSGAGVALNRQFSLTWQPSSVVRIFGTLAQNNAPSMASFRNIPILETPGQLYFDPFRNETVEVTEVSGGVRTTAPQRSSQSQLGLALSPPGPLNLGLSIDYEYRRDRNVLSALPQASPVILALFPERFMRDPSGRLTTVDIRPVLFPGRAERELRSAVNLSFPLDGRRQAVANEDGHDRQDSEEREGLTSNARLQFNLAHTFLIGSKLDVGNDQTINLLSRRAIAFGGGRVRHQLDGSLSLSTRGLGLRLTGSHRSRSLIENGVQDGAPSVIRFGGLTLLNLRVFANADRVFGHSLWTRGSRITLSASNLANTRQRVRDDSGLTPLVFQPGYRDPTGRTIEVELRRRL